MAPGDVIQVAGGECAAALAELRDVVASTGGGEPVEMVDGPVPQDGEGRATVVITPVSLVPARGGGPTGRIVTSAEVTMQVLLTARGGSAAEQACLVADLALRLIEAGRWTLDADGPQLDLWRALGLTPRPGLLIEVKVRRLLDRGVAPPVRHPIRLRSMPVRELSGRVVASDGTPISAAVVMAMPDGPRTTTDHRGRFTLTVALPDDGLQARVRARGLDVVVPLGAAGDDGGIGDLVLAGLPT